MCESSIFLKIHCSFQVKLLVSSSILNILVNKPTENNIFRKCVWVMITSGPSLKFNAWVLYSIVQIIHRFFKLELWQFPTRSATWIITIWLGSQDAKPWVVSEEKGSGPHMKVQLNWFTNAYHMNSWVIITCLRLDEGQENSRKVRFSLLLCRF